MLKWGETKYGYSGDFEEFTQDNKEYFIFCGYVGSGIISTNIYIFSKNKDTKERWQNESVFWNIKKNVNVIHKSDIKVLEVKSDSGEVLQTYNLK